MNAFPKVGRPLRGRLASIVIPPAARGADGPPRRIRGFTLIELLTVIAIIGILAAILVPSVGGARKSANKARTRAQFSQWSTALEAFRQEYGSYPQFFPAGAQKLVNQGATTQANGNHLFHDILSGVRRDGSQLTGAVTGNPVPALGQNTRRIRFVNFTDADFVTQGDVTAGHNTAQQLNFLRDAFRNTVIGFVTDSNLDGVINARDSTGGYPPVTAPGGTALLRPPVADLPAANTGGIHAGVIFYSAPPGATSPEDLIMSWK